jgi:hypothetical protein
MTPEELERLKMLLSMSPQSAYQAPGTAGYVPFNVAAPITPPQAVAPVQRAPSMPMPMPAAPSMEQAMGGGAAGGSGGLRNIQGLLEKIKSATGPGVTFRDNLLGSNYIRGAAIPQNPNIGLPNNAFGIQGNIGSIARQAMPMRFSGNLFGL